MKKYLSVLLLLFAFVFSFNATCNAQMIWENTQYPVSSDAGAWNGVYERKDLLAEFTLDQLSAKIAAGDFSGIPIGSYIETDIKPSVDGAVLALSGNSTSGTTAYDISGNANNATMSNVTLSADTDKAFVCSQLTSNISGNITLTGDFTVRIITNPIDLNSKYLFCLSDSSNSPVVLYTNNYFRYYLDGTHAYDVVCQCEQNTENDIAVTINLTTKKMIVYKNGLFVGEKDISQSTHNINKFCFGDYYNTRGWGFNGTMKGIKIYPRALSADEILQLHTATQDEGLTERVRWLVAGLDHYLHCGHTPIEDHHLVMVAEDCLKNTAKMNATNTTEGGYIGSSFYRCLQAFNNDMTLSLHGHKFNAKNSILLSSSVSTTLPSMAGAGLTGASNNWSWEYFRIQLMNEPELYGTTVLSSSLYDVGTSKTQFPLFRLRPDLIRCGRGINGSTLSRATYWLRSVATSANFCVCDVDGSAYYGGADHVYGIRPFFLFK